jgi:hypothetical protein
MRLKQIRIGFTRDVWHHCNEGKEIVQAFIAKGL